MKVFSLPSNAPFDDHVAASSASPKVLYLIPSDACGGVETAARSAAETPKLSCDLVLMFLAGRTLAADRRRIIDHPGRRLNSPSTYMKGLLEILRHKPDVLICSLWRSVFLGTVVKIVRPRTRFVFFLHNVVAEHFVDRFVHWLAFSAADEVWADSEATLSARSASRRRPARVISFVTGFRDPTAPPVAAPLFVNWSRLHFQKGHDRSIRLIDAMVRRGVDAHLEIWGPEDGAKPALEELVAKLGLGSRVRFNGPARQDQLAAIASKSSFYLQLSRYEGMAMSVVEAMQLGLVPVVTAVGQIPSYLQHNENGIIADPQHLELAAEELQQLLAHPERFGPMSSAAAAQWRFHSSYADDLCSAALTLANSKQSIR